MPVRTPTSTQQLRRKLLQARVTQSTAAQVDIYSTPGSTSGLNWDGRYYSISIRPHLSATVGGHAQQRSFNATKSNRFSPLPNPFLWQNISTRQVSSSQPNLPTDGFNTSNTTNSLATPDITNYYTIFPTTIPLGPPPASPFDISNPSLRREFLKLQALAHPDKFPPGPAKERAEALSSRINQAYRTLADPLLRAQYLLCEWHGIDVTAEDGGAASIQLDPSTLMVVMDVQEKIEELGQEENAPAEIEKMKEENTQRIQETVEKLGMAFDSRDIETAKSECVRLRFWYSLGEGLREWEPGRTEIRLIH